MAKVKYPKVLFVTQNQFSDKSGKWFSAEADQVIAVGNDDRVGDTVASYVLSKVNHAKLKAPEVEFVQPKKKAQRKK